MESCLGTQNEDCWARLATLLGKVGLYVTSLARKYMPRSTCGAISMVKVGQIKTNLARIPLPNPQKFMCLE